MPDSSEPRSSGTPARDPYAAWRSPNYCCYAVGWFLLAFSSQMSTVAVGIHLYNLCGELYGQTQGALALGLVGLVQGLPVMLLAIAGGQIADRYNRQRVMMATLALGTLVSLGLAAASYAAAPATWFYLLLGLGAVSQGLGTPSRAALLPQIVRPEVFSNAMTWNTSVFHVATMTGPVVGGLLLALDPSAATAFAVVAACRLLSVATVALVVCRPSERPAESISLANAAAGIRFVLGQKEILGAITLDLLAVLLGGMTFLLPIFAKDILQLDRPDVAVGLFRSAEAVGAVAMAMLIAHAPPMRRAGRTMLWAVAGFGMCTILFGLSRSFWLSLSMMFLLGAFDNVSVVVRHTLVQMLTPDSMRGRVSAVNSIFIVASNELGGFESGLTAWLVGPVVSVIGGGIGTLLVVLGAARLWPQLLAIGVLADVRPAEPPPAEEEVADRWADLP